jgi:hypothetical protein
MAMNPIQFQTGLSFTDFFNRYGTEAQCEAALLTLRWPNGWRCSRCAGSRWFATRNRTGRALRECFLCGYQCSSIVGTIMEHTKLALTKWFLAMHLMTASKNEISALELKRGLGVTYKTAWALKHKLMEVMAIREEPRRLDGRVEIDDAYLGGEREGNINGGRGALNKTAFVAAVQTSEDGRPLYMRLRPIVGFTKVAMREWASECLASTAHVVSDGTACFYQVKQVGATHERYVTGSGRAAAKMPQFRWVNTMLGNLKTAFAGTFHSIAHKKYAHRYLACFSYRFNRRFDLSTIMTRLLRAAVATQPQPLRVLRRSEAGI